MQRLARQTPPLEETLSHRRESRTQLFVMATIYSDSGAGPVKVRNLSCRGALIEGAVIPTVGSEVRLSRGSLTASGRVVWSRDGQAGLQFASRVNVAEWMPRGRPRPQQIVDEMVQQVKAGVQKELPSSIWETRERPSLTAPQIIELRSLLEALADDLGSDPDVVTRHGDKLQTLDLVAQSLTKLANERP